jgi:hypothetical protein
LTTIEFLQYAIICSAISVFIAKAIDFLIGKPGNRWIKDKLILKSWFRLQSFQPVGFFKRAAHNFSKLTEIVFGKQLISERAYVVSTIISSFFLTVIFVSLNSQLHFSRPIVHQPSLLAWLIVFAGINPLFDFLSFAVTRYLAHRISESGKLRYALSFWVIDVVLCITISFLTYYSVEVFLRYFAPDFSQALWFGRITTHDVTIFSAFSGYIPTLLHLMFFIISLCLGLMELFRRFVCLLLERFDEADNNVLTLLTASLAALGTLLGAIISFIKGAS